MTFTQMLLATHKSLMNPHTARLPGEGTRGPRAKPVPEAKPCTKCHKTLPIKAFRVSKTRGHLKYYRGACKTCESTKSRA